MAMSGEERRELRARANVLRSRVTVGKEGLTEGVLAEIRRELDKNGLVKVRIRAEDHEAIDSLARQIAEAAQCELVGRSGFVATFFRAKPEERGTG